MVQGSKTQKIILDNHGSYLGMEKGCFTVKDKDGNVQRYPLFEKEIGEVILKSGNMVSTGALASLGFWDVDVLIMTQRGRPVAMLKALDNNSHVETRIMQYEALKNEKGLEIAKNIILGKINGQNQVLKKYGLKQLDFSIVEKIMNLDFEDLGKFRCRLLPIEGHASDIYFHKIFGLFPENLRPDNRRGFKAYDGLNNLFNLGYEMLSWKVHKAIINAKLEPYLGFLHSVHYEMPSLVCDLIEIYRFLIDDFLINNFAELGKKDFIMKQEVTLRKRIGKREYLNDVDSKGLMRGLNELFEVKVDIPRIMHGKKQSLETLISEEAFLLASYLRNEKKEWNPRIPII